ncbi:MAG: hypothetical protein WC599_12385 [Bacteroidales bacterium]
MFNKFLNIVLVILLLASTAGITINKHYFGNKLLFTTFFHKKSCCKTSCNCCHNEVKQVKVKDAFQISKVSLPDKTNTIKEIVSVVLNFSFMVLSNPVKHFIYLPPGMTIIPAFLQIFRI